MPTPPPVSAPVSLSPGVVSQRQGMGAIPFSGGVTFRVWAPFASQVAVAGSFNSWDTRLAQLAQEGNGYWSLDVAGAAIGDQYKFIITSASSGTVLWRADPYARAMTESDGNCIVVGVDFDWQATEFSTPPWNDMVIYELHVGSFVFDPSNPGGHGDFDSAIEKIGYLRDLGVSVIQIMPSAEFAGGSSEGYDPADIFAAEHLYGGSSAFAKFVDAAHSAGMAVILDVVYNHFGPSDLDLWVFDGWSENGSGGIYFYNDWRRVTPWGDTRPDYGRGEVRQFIRDDVLYWLENLRCDGLRFDATGYIRNVWGNNNDAGADLADGWSLLQWLNSEVDARQPWKILIAEDMQDNEWITRTSESGGAGLDSQWGAGFVHGVRDVIVPPDDAGRDMERLAGLVSQKFNDNAWERVVYTESHDEDAASSGQARVPELIWPGNADSYFSQKRSVLGAAMLLTSPGIPMIFMGQEFLEWGSWSDSTSLDWSKEQTFGGIRNLYQDLIHLRRNWYDTAAGLKGQGINVHHVNQSDKVIAFHRWDQGGARDDVVILANFANVSYDRYAIGLPRAGLWKVRFNSDWSGYSPAFTNHPSTDQWTSGAAADQMPVSGAFGLGPYGVLILTQDE